MTRDEFTPVVAYLAAAVGKPVGREQAEVYFDLLADLPAPLVWLAVKRAVAESRYPTVPPVGVIRAAAAEAAGADAPTWPEAWALVCREVRRHGLGRQAEALAALPPPARRAAEAVGWRALCDATEGGLDTLRAQFRDAYGTLSEREGREARLPANLRPDVARLAGGIGALPMPPGGEGGE